MLAEFMLCLSGYSYRVGNDQDVGIGSSFGDGFGEVANDASVSVEQV